VANSADNARTINNTIGFWAGQAPPNSFGSTAPALTSDGSQFSVTIYGPSPASVEQKRFECEHLNGNSTFLKTFVRGSEMPEKR